MSEMTVKALRQKLEKLPDNASIWVMDICGKAYGRVVSVTTTTEDVLGYDLDRTTTNVYLDTHK